MGVVRKGFQEVDSPATGAMQKSGLGWVGYKFRREPIATIAHSEGDLAIADAALELNFVRAALLTAVPDRIGDTFGKRQEHVVLKVRWYAGLIELAAGPVMDLLQFIECAGYQEVLHVRSD
ncbi:MAG: hypothetical protein Q8922_06510 [Bacteroidota bacterium]|nr:hypothetical protein [Bacteroidota bacterium]MDP4233810.1 hypothetical protein [Bacteroidota bacterium]MDP4242449.1 hypothetical protein [Bacteroidota bacterium]MDP4287571.1 hypothetical protein [Bacteroidota bacterium]